MSITPAQQLGLDAIRRKWMKNQCTRPSDDFIRQSFKDLWAYLGHPEPEIEIFNNPRAARDAAPPGSQGCWLLWWQCHACWYEGAEYLGRDFDENKRRILTNVALSSPYCVSFVEKLFISRNPVALHHDDRERLHREDGPAGDWGDGYGLWYLEGIRLTEQIVMRPETLTVRQIEETRNTEEQRIMIERFGWLRYLAESRSTILDEGRNDIENTYEILANTPLGQRLVTCCPSTGRRYALSIPTPRVRTREAAQARLWGDRKGVRFLGRT